MKLPYAITLLLCLFLSACTLPDRFSAVAFQQLTLLQARSTRFLQDAARIPWQKETLLKDDRDIRQIFFQAERVARQGGDKHRLDNLALLKNHYLRLYARVMRGLCDVSNHLLTSRLRDTNSKIIRSGN